MTISLESIDLTTILGVCSLMDQNGQYYADLWDMPGIRQQLVSPDDLNSQINILSERLFGQIKTRKFKAIDVANEVPGTTEDQTRKIVMCLKERGHVEKVPMSRSEFRFTK